MKRNKQRPAMKESPVIRHPGNPILSAKDIPYEANLVFNAGVVKHGGRYVMLFRDDLPDLCRPLK